MYNSVFLRFFKLLHSRHCYVIPEHFLRPQRNAIAIRSLSIPCSPQTLATTSLLSGSMDLSILHISDKWMLEVVIKRM